MKTESRPAARRSYASCRSVLAGSLIAALSSVVTAQAPKRADIGVSQSAPASWSVNSQFNYTITATNNGPDPAMGVTITDILPIGVTFVSATGCTGDGGGPVVSNGGTVSCQVASLSVANAVVVTITARPTASGTMKNVVGAIANELDTNMTNNSAIATTTVAGPPTITSVSPAAGTTGGGTSITVTGTNLGSGTTVTIGGVTASVTSVNPPTQITATTGAHACGAADVVVANSAGGATLPVGYYYNSPASPGGLSPNGTVFAATNSTVTLAWIATPGADRYAVRVQDLQGGATLDPRNTCSASNVYVCVDNVMATSFTVTVRPGHSYNWWLHAGNICQQYSLQTNATFSVAAPVDNASFIGQTPPPSCMLPGSTAAVAVTMSNSGSTVWDSNFRLGSLNPQDNTTWGPGRVYLAPGETVQPGQQKTFTFNVTAPSGPGVSNFQWRMVHEGVQWFGTSTPNAAVTIKPVAVTPASTPADRLWVDDQLPAGAIAQGIWNWDTTQKASGSQSNTEPSVAGFHQHYFTGATQTLTIQDGEKLFAYVLLDPCDPPQEVMLQWFDGSWEHRAFWGQDLIGVGQSGTAGRIAMGSLPAPGQWVRLEVPVQALGLAGSTLNGMAFTLSGGKAWFDRAGAAPAAVSGFYTVVPCRAVDTRNASGAYGGPALPASGFRAFPLSSQCGIPSGAKAVAVNLTVVGATAAGNLISYPSNFAVPATSSLNFGAGQTRGNNAVIPVAQDGTAGISIFNASAGSNHLIIDVVGYFQ